MASAAVAGGFFEAWAERTARRAAKAVAARALYHSGARSLMARLRRVSAGGARVLILSYHRVVGDFAEDAKTGLPSLMIGRDTFRRHVEHLANEFEVLSLDGALAVLAGRRKAQRDVAVLTFDDGYRDNFQHAYPILREAGVPAHVFLPTDYTGTAAALPHDRLYRALTLLEGRRVDPRTLGLTPDAAAALDAARAGASEVPGQIEALIATHPTSTVTALAERLERRLGLSPLDGIPDGARPLTWDQCREMAAHGVDFGGHTGGHTVLVHESPACIEREVRRCKEAIAEHLGAPPRHFAYPNGYYHPGVAAALAAHGFRSAVTTEDEPNEPGVDPFRLRRKVLWEEFSRGPFGRYSHPLTACQLDDVFGMLALRKAVPGLLDTRAKFEAAPAPAAAPALKAAG